MAENTKIEWASHTFNPWVGCTKVSPACDHCYAEGWAKRTGQADLWNGERRRTSQTNWREPYKWNNAAPLSGSRPRVFCASLADVFDNQAPAEWRRDLFWMIHETPNLDWLLLTKRPQNIAKMLPADWGKGYPNVWLGTTVENQAEADRRIPNLLAVPAAIRFLSCEPLLGPLDLDQIYLRRDGQIPNNLSIWLGDYVRPLRGNFTDSPKINWVIAGGESGPGARPMHPAWARSLRDQCAEAGVAFHFKQWGEFRPYEPGDPEIPSAKTAWPDGHMGGGSHTANGGLGAALMKLGKARAGRLLDGVQHDGYPA